MTKKMTKNNNNKAIIRAGRAALAAKKKNNKAIPRPVLHVVPTQVKTRKHPMQWYNIITVL
jgi:hypothetical protein